MQIQNPLGMTSQRTIAYSASGAWWDSKTPPQFAEVVGTITIDAHLSDADIALRVHDVLTFDERN